MFSLPTFILFLTSSLLLIIAPGPDVVFALTQGLSNGKKAGFLTAFGLAFGNVFHILLATLGVSVIFKTSIVAFTVVKVFGGLYLFYLAYKAIKYRNEKISLKDQPKRSSMKMFRKGLIMNMLNPKVAIFFLAYFPQFVMDGPISATLQMLILGAIFISMVVVIFGSVGYFAGYFGDRLSKYRNFSRNMNVLSSIVFIGLGLKIIFLQQ